MLEEKKVFSDKQKLSNSTAKLIGSELDMTYDTTAKNLFANKEVLSVIAERFVKEVKGYSRKEIAARIDDVKISENPVSFNSMITGMNTESNYIGEKTIYYDIKTKIFGKVEIILNLEIQREDNPGYILKKRGYYYVARSYSEQLSDITKDTHYNSLKKVYSIWIVVNTSKTGVEEYSFVNTKTGEPDESDPFSLVMIYLGKNCEEEEEIIKYIHALFHKDIEFLLSKYYIVNSEMEREMNNMCNLSQGIREESERIGMERGIERAVLNMYTKGMSIEEIGYYQNLPIEKVKEICHNINKK